MKKRSLCWLLGVFFFLKQSHKSKMFEMERIYYPSNSRLIPVHVDQKRWLNFYFYCIRNLWSRRISLCLSFDYYSWPSIFNVSEICDLDGFRCVFHSITTVSTLRLRHLQGCFYNLHKTSKIITSILHSKTLVSCVFSEKKHVLKSTTTL